VHDRAKACIYASEAYFEFKKLPVFLACFRFLKNQSLNFLTALSMQNYEIGGALSKCENSKSSKEKTVWEAQPQ
jgi:hypothetical protein